MIERQAVSPTAAISHRRCDLKKPISAKPWVLSRGSTATPQRGNVGPMGLKRLLASRLRALPWAVLGRTFGATVKNERYLRNYQF
jgi:hypothetical protein